MVRRSRAGCGTSLVLGGAALQRCDKDFVLISGFSRRGHRFDSFRSLLVRRKGYLDCALLAFPSLAIFLAAPSRPLWFQAFLANHEVHPSVTLRAASGTRRSETTLREAADRAGLLVGTAVRPEHLSEPLYAATLAREFNLLEPEDAMKWEVLRPDAQSFDFSQADRIVDFAAQHRMKVRGHTLVWHRQNPRWLTQGKYTSGELAQILERHIKRVVGHYRGKVFAWDVVNEAFDELQPGQLRSTIWLDQP